MGLMLGPRPSQPAPAADPTGTPVVLPEGWAAKAADRIVTTVDAVRAKTTTPVQKAGRAVVWGLLVLTAGLAIAVLALTGALRLLQLAFDSIPGIGHGRSNWIAELLLGVVLLVAGLLVIRKGQAPASDG